MRGIGSAKFHLDKKGFPPYQSPKEVRTFKLQIELSAVVRILKTIRTSCTLLKGFLPIPVEPTQRLAVKRVENHAPFPLQ